MLRIEASLSLIEIGICVVGGILPFTFCSRHRLFSWCLHRLTIREFWNELGYIFMRDEAAELITLFPILIPK